MALSETRIRLNNVRVAFPKFGAPESFPGGQDPTKYWSASFILPKDHPQIKQLQDLMLSLAIGKWGPKKGPQVLAAAKAIGKVFLRDGDAKAQHDGFEGNMFVAARAKENDQPDYRDGMRAVLTPAQAKAFLAACEGAECKRLKGWVALCLFCGLRPESEAPRLTWAEVNFQSGECSVMSRKRGAKPRVFKMTPQALAWMLAVMEDGAAQPGRYWRRGRRSGRLRS